MKKLTLNKTWTECLRMWKWIAKEKKAGNLSRVVILKSKWLNEHGYNADEIQDTCFFCDYVRRKTCCDCPGKKVNPGFDCEDENCEYDSEPIAFYNKLVALNKKRLK